MSLGRISATQNVYETVSASASRDSESRDIEMDEISPAVDDRDGGDAGNPFLTPATVETRGAGVVNKGAYFNNRKRMNELAVKVESLEASVTHQLEKAALEEAAFGKKSSVNGKGRLRERNSSPHRGMTWERVGNDVRSACNCLGNVLNNRFTRFVIAVVIILLLVALINEVRKLVIARAEQPPGMTFGKKGGDPEDDLDVPFGDIE